MTDEVQGDHEVAAVLGRQFIRSRGDARRAVLEHGLDWGEQFLPLVEAVGLPTKLMVGSWLAHPAVARVAVPLGINLPDIDWGSLIDTLGPIIAAMMANCMK